MTISQWWWTKKKRREMNKVMDMIDMHLSIFQARTSNSYYGNPRNGTKDLSCRRSYKLRGVPRTLFGPSQHNFAEIMIDLKAERKILERFIQRYS